MTRRIHIFGIRHHGPGSARSMRKALILLRPDAILIEGPTDANDLMHFVANREMRPPVALLLYVQNNPDKAIFYPFAEYSPEWQAINFGLKNNTHVEFMDLPVSHQFAIKFPESESPDSELDKIQDPIQMLAEAAGYDDSERWWGNLIEENNNPEEIFQSIYEAMASLREKNPVPKSYREQLREAWMRRSIREAKRKGYERIAVICGAWHGPLLDIESKYAPTEKEDSDLLKKLPQIKIEVTWTPWTNDRLTLRSGYGAGILSPGWYKHLWSTNNHIAEKWISLVAKLLRKEDLDVSPAQLIDAIRLADTLATLRERKIPGLYEINESIKSVLCFGNDLPLRLIHEKLIVGNILGKVPQAVPDSPLQNDFRKTVKRLRLHIDPEERTLDLDLRKSTDLERGRLLHRLNLLQIHWGNLQEVAGKSGTFHEIWTIKWNPDFVINLINAGTWGKTILEACVFYTHSLCNKAPNLSTLTKLLNQIILADLPDSVDSVVHQLQNTVAVTSNISELITTLPPLVEIIRYSDVRKTDTSMIKQIMDGLLIRICIGLPVTCSSLSIDAATNMLGMLTTVNTAVRTLQNQKYSSLWADTIFRLAESSRLHGLIAGYATRLAYDSGRLTKEDTINRLSLALSTSVDPAEAMYWIEGFLKHSGSLLIHDETLLNIINNWVLSLSNDRFTASLPLLRKTFAEFTSPERRKIGERIHKTEQLNTHVDTVNVNTPVNTNPEAPDNESKQTEKVLPIILKLLGFKK